MANPKKNRERVRIGHGVAKDDWNESIATPLMRSPFLLWERRTMAEASWGFLEERKMREKRAGGFFPFLEERKMREKSEMMVASSVQLTAV
jgi:hypothetical protein